MKIEDLKQTYGYKQVNTYMTVYFSVGLFTALFIVVGLVNQLPVFTIVGLALTGFMFYLSWNQFQMLRKIKIHAKSFEICEAKAINVATLASNYRYNRIVFEFEDFMGEFHRMESNNIVQSYELELYLEKTMEICYSPHLERVLIMNQLTREETQKTEEKNEDDPFSY
ncbi:MAG: hypothetical protein WC992_00855 [Acholeplasmataceae bacterium]|jgi:hypothetical protein|nr:hypothetical protein [Acholeplasmataceae bacterium]